MNAEERALLFGVPPREFTVVEEGDTWYVVVSKQRTMQAAIEVAKRNARWMRGRVIWTNADGSIGKAVYE